MGICITLCHYTVHCIIRTRAQSVRRQHKKRNSEKRELVTYKDISQVARKMWLSFIWIKPLVRMGHNMLKWLVIHLLAFCWWATLDQIITGFPADISFSWIKPFGRRRHRILADPPLVGSALDLHLCVCMSICVSSVD